jgi:hypothetical protein
MLFELGLGLKVFECFRRRVVVPLAYLKFFRILDKVRLLYEILKFNLLDLFGHRVRIVVILQQTALSLDWIDLRFIPSPESFLPQLVFDTEYLFS